MLISGNPWCDAVSLGFERAWISRNVRIATIRKQPMEYWARCQRNHRMLTRQCLHRLHISLRNEMNYNADRTGEIGLTTCGSFYDTRVWGVRNVRIATIRKQPMEYWARCQRNHRMLTRQCLHRLHISLRNEMNYNADRTGEIGLTTCDYFLWRR